jgi:transposase InsO family protein
MKRRKQYTEVFKREVVRIVANTEKPIREVEKDLGLSAPRRSAHAPWATVLDVCSRQIVGWSMSERQQ